MTSLNICTFNVKGLGAKIKREQVFTWLKTKSIDIAMLQELHYDNKQVNTDWAQAWGEDVFCSGQSTNSLGIGILLKRNQHIHIIDYTEVIVGRLQVLKVKIYNSQIALINIYAPNNDDLDFFNTLENTITSLDEYSLIIGGDFNVVQDFKLDKLNGKTTTKSKCSNKVNYIKDNYDLTDIYRNFNPFKSAFTWHSNTNPPIFSRLDYFLISSCLISNARNCSIKTGFKSDHSIVILDIHFDLIERGPGYFKLNNSLLFDTEYKLKIKHAIAEVVHFNGDANPNILWELIKGRVRDESIKFAANKKKNNIKTEKELENNIRNMEEQLQKKPNDPILMQNYKKEKDAYNALNEEKIKGFLIRSKAEWIEGAEKNTKFFANFESKRSEQKVIKQLRINNTIETDHVTILKEIKEYYASLYTADILMNYDDNSPFFENVVKLSDEDRAKHPEQLTEYECCNALKEMKNNKSPGSDGLTIEFYKLFWNDIKQYLINSLNFSFQHGHLTPIQNQCIISLLPKKENDILYINNWRPVSLLNVDYKIATKSIANRIKIFIEKLINYDQTGFIKGRYIGENIRILNEIIDKVNENNEPGLIFFSDFQKAFDSLDHTFMFKCLETMGFSQSTINWVKLFYSNANSCITNNGYFSEFFNIKKGVRQGCPLSPSLFIIA